MATNYVTRFVLGTGYQVLDTVSREKEETQALHRRDRRQVDVARADRRRASHAPRGEHQEEEGPHQAQAQAHYGTTSLRRPLAHCVGQHRPEIMLGTHYSVLLMRTHRLLLRHTALALFLCSVALAQGVSPTRTVGQPVLNMFSAATTDSDVVSQAIYATNVTVLQEKDGWAEIQTPDQYKGWVETSGLLPYKPGEPYASGKNVVQVRSLFAHLYRETDVTKHAPLLTVPFETRLEVAALPDAAKPKHWLTALLPDGRHGMIQSGDVQIPGAPLSIDADIELARKFMGLPYTWGGTSS